MTIHTLTGAAGLTLNSDEHERCRRAWREAYATGAMVCIDTTVDALLGAAEAGDRWDDERRILYVQPDRPSNGYRVGGGMVQIVDSGALEALRRGR